LAVDGWRPDRKTGANAGRDSSRLSLIVTGEAVHGIPSAALLTVDRCPLTLTVRSPTHDPL
jgi:hypothetical protein